jgi:4-hydroxy-2-oxoheptanedioate aldolase
MRYQHSRSGPAKSRPRGLGPRAKIELSDAGRRGARTEKVRKPAGILTPNEEEAKRFIQWGYTFVAVGADLGLLARGADALAGRFKG